MRTGAALATSSVFGRVLTAVLLLGLVLGRGRVRADDEEDGKTANRGRVVIDRVDVEPSRLGLARVRALVTAMQLRGARIEFPGTAKGGLTWKLGGAKPSDPIVGTFDASDAELAMVILVPITYDFDADLEPIRMHLKEELITPLGKLGPRFKVAVLGYAESTTGSKNLGNANAAIAALDKLEIDSTPPALAAAVQRAVTLIKNAIKKPKNPGALVKGVVVVISDGGGITPEEHAAITKIGVNARKDNVRIHSLAYSPVGRKRPLFTLGELSRQSLGTFRWIRTGDGWSAGLAQLLDELQKQTVLTFFAPPDEIVDKKLTVSVPLAGNLIEAEGVKLPPSSCGPDDCAGYCSHDVCVIPQKAGGGGPLKLILIIGGGIVGLGLVVLGGLTVARRKRVSGSAPFPPGAMPGAPGMPGAAPVPGAPAMPQAAAVIQPGAPIFIIVSGPKANQRVALKNGFTIGKAPGSDLDLSDDSFASGSHALVTFDGQAWWLTDRGSTNGTFVNNNRIQQVRLEPGMTVKLGSTEVRFWTA